MDICNQLRTWTRLIENAGTVYYHGTSKYALDQIQSDTNTIRPVYIDSNVSLGGAYFTTRKEIAKSAAITAARAHNSTPVILTIQPKYELLPDEDWVVPAAERPHREDFDYGSDTYKSERYQGFFDDLFSEYMGDGHSLSDEYARRYHELNDFHNITYQDSLKYTGSVRQEKPLSADQIIDVEEL